MELDESMDEAFLEHVNRDPLEYYFFLLDWEINREDSKFLLAREDGAIRGMMLIYKDYVAQFRGSREAVELLFGHLDLAKTDIIVPMGMGDIILRSYRPVVEHELVLMHLDKGRERILKVCEAVRPSARDGDAIAKLMRDVYPDFWGKETGKTIRESMKKNSWLAVEENDMVVSVGNMFFADFGSNIGVIATRENFRNRGYATTIVSSLVEEIFQRGDRALIHVFADNGPAVHSYGKVGFRPYKSYVLVKGERV